MVKHRPLGVAASLSAAGLTKLVADSAAPSAIRIQLSADSVGRPWPTVRSCYRLLR